MSSLIGIPKDPPTDEPIACSSFIFDNHDRRRWVSQTSSKCQFNKSIQLTFADSESVWRKKWKISLQIETNRPAQRPSEDSTATIVAHN
jgi:hypothetical protein